MRRNEDPDREAAHVAMAIAEGASGTDTEATDTILAGLYPTPSDDARKRVRGHVVRGRRLIGHLGENPFDEHADPTAWWRWAIAIALRTDLRDPQQLRDLYNHAAHWLLRSDGGRAWRESAMAVPISHRGRDVAITFPGLLSEVALALHKRDPERLRAWPHTQTRAFRACNWGNRVDS